MSNAITIHLSSDEALVLFEFFSRFAETNRFRLMDNAEFVAFSTVSAQLDKTLVEPFTAGYVQALAQARERIAGDFEGIAPGVEP